jgi:hypothetical protein
LHAATYGSGLEHFSIANRTKHLAAKARFVSHLTKRPHASGLKPTILRKIAELFAGSPFSFFARAILRP